eukprot:Nk52_evm16s2579 gene=Nk52_evmTU16s2579
MAGGLREARAKGLQAKQYVVVIGTENEVKWWQIVNMLMPKKNRVAVYEFLFKEGVCVAKKDFNLPKHPEIDVPNLHVIKACQSLVSRGYLKESFAWQHYYWYLTNEGIMYLREFLHLPTEIVPATLKKTARPVAARPPRYGEREHRDRGDDRDSYRRGGDGEKKGAPGPDFKPEFRGGYGRGRGSAAAGRGGFNQ